MVFVRVGAEGKGRQSCCLMRTEFQVWKMKKVQGMDGDGVQQGEYI